MSVEERVRDHFHADAARFDAIYEDEKGPFARWIDERWRGVVRRRFELVLELLEPLEGKSVLDVGTGSGRYCLAYAQRGARRAVGIDFAPAMIELAREHSRRMGVEDRCEFHVGIFPDDLPAGTYDASTAMGFFDYVPDAGAMLRAMRDRTSGTLIASFPKAREWRVPLRRVRFRVMRVPLYLYREAEVRALLSEAGLTDHELIDLGRDYVVVAKR